MKKNTALLIIGFISIFSAHAQEPAITGNWYSKDGSRQYFIRKTEQSWEAILVRSNRETDTSGKLILSLLQKKKNRYRGTIYSVSDGQYTTVTIRPGRGKEDVLVLKLKRMLLLDVTIKWYRDTRTAGF